MHSLLLLKIVPTSTPLIQVGDEISFLGYTAKRTLHRLPSRLVIESWASGFERNTSSRMKTPRREELLTT